MLEPADSQEAYDFVAEAFALSEEFDTPGAAAHHDPPLPRPRPRACRAVRIALPPREYERDIAKYVMVPQYARRRNRLVLERLRAAAATRPRSRRSTCCEAGTVDFGIIASGVAYQYAREAFPKAWFLKLGMSQPLPYEKVAQLYRLRVPGRRGRGARPVPRGAGARPRAAGDRQGGHPGGRRARPGRSSSRALEPFVSRAGRRAAGARCCRRRRGWRPPPQPAPGLPVRPPVLCPAARTAPSTPPCAGASCRRSATSAATPSARCRRSLALDSCLCMGASVGMMAGINKALGRKAAAAVIGDSTFFHSGVTPLIDAHYNESDGPGPGARQPHHRDDGPPGPPRDGPARRPQPGAGGRRPAPLRGHRRALHDGRRQRLQGAGRGHQGRGRRRRASACSSRSRPASS